MRTVGRYLAAGRDLLNRLVLVTALGIVLVALTGRPIAVVTCPGALIVGAVLGWAGHSIAHCSSRETKGRRP